MTKTKFPTQVTGSRLRAFYREYPWAKAHVPEHTVVTGLSVQQLDAECALRPLVSFAAFEEGPLDILVDQNRYYRESEQLLVLDASGGLLGTAGVVPYTPPRRLWRRNPKPTTRFDTSDTLESLLARMGKQTDKIHFVLSVMPVPISGPHRNGFGDEYYEDINLGVSVTVHKLKGVHILKQIERSLKAEQKKIREAA